MRTRFAITLALLLVAIPYRAEELRRIDFLEVGGEVRAGVTSPIEDALVIAFSLSDSLSLRTSSGRGGRFFLPPLPVGVYRVVAVKRGLLPAFTTVTPVKKDHSVTLDLEARQFATEEQKVDAWTIRRSLPKDVLREVEMVLGEASEYESSEAVSRRFSGSMESLSGYSGDPSARDLERSTVSLSSELGRWDLEFHGSRQFVSQSDLPGKSQEPAEAEDVVLVVRSSPSSTYRVASARASWFEGLATRRQAGVEAHSLSWQGRRSSVHVRYQAQENLFRADVPEESLEVSGNALVYRGPMSDLGVSVSLRQDNRLGEGVGSQDLLRFADLGTSSRVNLGDGLDLECGVVTRLGEEILEVMPQTAADLRLGTVANVQIAAAYKFAPRAIGRHTAPAVGHMGRLSSLDTRYRYSIRVATDLGENAAISASARRAAADALTFLLFDDRFDEFWDGLYLERGDVLTDGVLSIRAGVGPSFEISVMTSGGSVESADSGPRKQYVSGEVRTHYEPTDTTLDVSYRLLEQPGLVDDLLLREIERLSVVIGQSLHLPVDLRLLLGFTIASEDEIVATNRDSERPYTRLVGGLSFSF